MRRLVSVVAAAAVGAVLVVSPAEAMPVRAFGAPTSVSGVGTDPYGAPLAVLSDGTVGVAWTEGTSSVHLAVRRPGTNLFTELTPLTLGGGFSVAVGGTPMQWPPVTLRAAGSEFLLGWGESGPTPRVRVARVGATASAVPAPTTVSGSDQLAGGSMAAFATASDGSAVAVWMRPGVGLPYEVRAARRVGVSGAWQQLGTAGATSLPYELVGAIDTSRSVTVGWSDFGGGSLDSFVRSHQGGAWGLAFVAGSTSPLLIGAVRQMAAASQGSATVIAVTDTISGASTFSGDAVARGIRVLHRATAGAPWSLAGPFAGPGRYATAPSVVMAPDGSAVVSAYDFGAGASPAVGERLTTLVVQRRGVSGAWGAPQSVSSVAAETGTMIQVAGGRWSPALAPDGTLVVPVPSPVAGGGGSIDTGLATLWRPGWAAPFTEQPLVSSEPPTLNQVSVGVDPSGRATVSWIDQAGPRVRAASTSLPKPYARSRATLSTTAPRVGAAVTCSSAWTGAKTLAFRWLRNGTAIAGATAKAYTPKSADLGATLACRVTATNPTGSTVSTSVARTVS